jgi:spore germination cell wall hydrolase CwlJ-like protein
MVVPDSLDLWVPARTIYGEARGEGSPGMEAVAHVLVNRVADGEWGKSLNSVCLWPYQFSCWLPGANLQSMVSVDDNDSLLSQCRNALILAMTSTHDPVSGATFYFADYITPPPWAGSMDFVTKIGHHLFYRKRITNHVVS